MRICISNLINISSDFCNWKEILHLNFVDSTSCLKSWPDVFFRNFMWFFILAVWKNFYKLWKFFSNSNFYPNFCLYFSIWTRVFHLVSLVHCCKFYSAFANFIKQNKVWICHDFAHVMILYVSTLYTSSVYTNHLYTHIIILYTSSFCICYDFASVFSLYMLSFYPCYHSSEQM